MSILIHSSTETVGLHCRQSQQPSAEQLIERAQNLLHTWLVDNTVEVFEERPEISEAHALLMQAIKALQAPSPIQPQPTLCTPDPSINHPIEQDRRLAAAATMNATRPRPPRP